MTEKPVVMESITFTCSACGWEFGVVGKFDGYHPRADTPGTDLTACQSVAAPVDDEPLPSVEDD